MKNYYCDVIRAIFFYKFEIRFGRSLKMRFDITVAPQVGLEPTTYGLTVRRSTN
jgi:hypothetical protein